LAKIDLHVHSKYSGRPADWFLQKFGTNESYTEPDIIYKTAKEEGMDFITVTDHNKIEASLILQKKYPDEVITGCEFTTYFPEDHCKIHLLTYGITEKQFEELNLLRENIYEMRNYIKENNIAYSIAHATYSINGKLTINHLEKLILMFDVFEGINGSRNRIGNDIWMLVLNSLTPEIIEELYNKHKIEPISKDPWVKGFTGGSDDHAALFIARTYTKTDALTKEELLDELKNKKTLAGGRHNDYRSFAFTLYKILYEFSKNQSKKISKSIISQLSEMVFEKKDFNFINWLKIQSIKKKKKKDKDDIKLHLYELIKTLKKNHELPFEMKFDMVFHKISDIFDGFIKLLLKSLSKSMKKGDIVNVIKNISSLIPGAFLTFPFFSTLYHMYSLRPIIRELEEKFLNKVLPKKKKIMWFTDTINELNGVAYTIKKIGWYGFSSGRDLKIVSSLNEDEINNELPPNFINIPSIFNFKMPHYETITLRIPSLLKTIEMLYEYEPDEVYISTPGPIGLLGFLFAKLISAKTIGVYHTDFTEQAKRIVKNDVLPEAIEITTKWFFTNMDKTAVPTNEYINILEQRGYDRNKMAVFKRGIDEIFYNNKYFDEYDRTLSNQMFNLLYAGRISEDKNIDFLIDIYKDIIKKNKNINLIIAGDGPYFEKLKKNVKEIKGIQLLGRIKREKLPNIYANADLFVFPSNTDTFGMVILEAHACGLPAIVSDLGGPKEIVKNKKTGFIINTDNKEKWIGIIDYVVNMKKNNPQSYIKMRKNAREHIVKEYNMEKVFKEIFEEDNKYLNKITDSNTTKKPEKILV